MNAQRSEIEFVDGLRVYAPNERAPDYIIANVVLERDALTAWLDGRDDKVRVVIKRSQGGKLYAAVDTYQRDAEPRRQAAKQESSQTGGFEDDDPNSIPF